MRGVELFPNWSRLSRLQGIVQMPLVAVCEPALPRSVCDELYSAYLLRVASFELAAPLVFAISSSRRPVVRARSSSLAPRDLEASSAPRSSTMPSLPLLGGGSGGAAARSAVVPTAATLSARLRARQLVLFDLPDHLLYYLLMFLDVPTLHAFAATCRRAKSMAARVFSHLLTSGACARAHTPPLPLPLHHSWLERRHRVFCFEPQHTAPVRTLVYDTAHDALFSAGFDRKVKVWLRSTAAPLQGTPGTTPSSGGGGEDCVCCCPYVDAGTLAGPAGVASIALWSSSSSSNSSNGSTGALATLAVGFRNGVVRVWQLPRSAAGLSAEQHAEAAAHSYGDTTAPWVLRSERQLAAYAEGYDFSSAKTTLVWESRGFVLDNSTGAVLAVLGGHTKRFTRLAYTSSSGAVLLSSSLDGTCRLWDLRADCSAGSAAVFRGHSAGVNDFVFLPQRAAGGDAFATASSDWSVMTWDARRCDEHAHSFVAHSGPVRCLCGVPGADTLLSGSDDGRVTQWQAADMAVVQQFLVHTSPVSAVCGDENHLFCASTAGTICGTDFY